MASDAFIAANARAFIESLSPESRARWEDTLQSLIADPFPDDGRTTYLPDGFPEQVYVHIAGDFWIAFVEFTPEVLGIVFIRFE